MIRKASFLEVASATLEILRAGTSFPWYDAIPIDAPTPLGMVEVVGKVDSSVKTTIKETFTVNVHVIAKATDARTEIYKLIQAAEEAMTQPMELPAPIKWLRSGEVGVVSMQQDETGEYHAVLQYAVMASYGLRVKKIHHHHHTDDTDTSEEETDGDGTT